MPKKSVLDKLLQEQQALNAAIKKAKAEQRKADAADHKRRCQIMGAALLLVLEENADLAAQLQPQLDAKITKAKDRSFIGLDPLPKEEKQDDNSTEQTAPVNAIQN